MVVDDHLTDGRDGRRSVATKRDETETTNGTPQSSPRAIGILARRLRLRRARFGVICFFVAVRLEGGLGDAATSRAGP